MRNLKTILLQLTVGLIPLVYLLIIWKSLPEVVPMHYNIYNVADQFGSKTGLFFMLAFMMSISIGVSLLILNLKKFDPIQQYQNDSSLPRKFSWLIVLFFSLLSIFIIYETQHYKHGADQGFTPKIFAMLIAFLFVIIGNFMNSLKQNYFIGIRTPWNLENEENWRKTHQLSSKIWFFGGLTIILLLIIFPKEYSLIVLLVGLCPLVIIPFYYSYSLFKKVEKERH